MATETDESEAGDEGPPIVVPPIFIHASEPSNLRGIIQKGDDKVSLTTDIVGFIARFVGAAAVTSVAPDALGF